LVNFKILPFARGGWRGIGEYHQNCPWSLLEKKGIARETRGVRRGYSSSLWQRSMTRRGG